MAKPRVLYVLPSVPWLAGGFAPAKIGWNDLLMDSIIEKASACKEPIHGGKFQSKLQWVWEACTDPEREFLHALEQACFEHCVDQYPRMSTWIRCDFLFLFGTAGTSHQQ